MRKERVDAILHHLADRVEELVDRRTDGDDERTRRRNLRRRGRKDESIAFEGAPQQLFPAVFDERQPTRSQEGEGIAIEVVHVDAIAGLGECQHERHADVAGPADNRQIGTLHARQRRCSRLVTGDIHANAPRSAPRDDRGGPPE